MGQEHSPDAYFKPKLKATKITEEDMLASEIGPSASKIGFLCLVEYK